MIDSYGGDGVCFGQRMLGAGGNQGLTWDCSAIGEKLLHGNIERCVKYGNYDLLLSWRELKQIVRNRKTMEPFILYWGQWKLFYIQNILWEFVDC